MIYNFKFIENKWNNKKYNFIFKKNKKKFYILNMFPYPSGSGLHIGHCIGYIFSDIIAKYKYSLGYNILNPIGFDSFGLPAEQYAINTGNKPQKIIKKSIKKYIRQIKKLSVIFNWEKLIITSKKKYYKWTQFIFIKMFNSYYDKKKNKARNIKFIIKKIKNWKKLNNKKKNKILNKYRIAYKKKSYVNWCPKLKTVLANDEIKNGKSLRGGYNIILKKTYQWHLRITKYINRLLNDFIYLKWPNNIINSQKKWIGKKKVYFFSIIIFKKKINIFTKYKNPFNKIILFYYPSNYIDYIFNFIQKRKKKKIYKILKNKKKYIISFYKKKKLIFYLTNYKYKKNIKNILLLKKKNIFFKKKVNLKIKIKNKKFIFFKKKKIKKTYIFNLNDIVFSRQRYWGEPFPIFYKNNIPYNISIKNLPLTLPNIKDKFNKIKNLKKIKKWYWDIKKQKIVKKTKKKNIYPLETDTMPSFAASNWYYLKFINNINYDKNIIQKKKEKYWKYVDLYLGGSEHANGHLIYSRFCYKFLKDLKIVNYLEPFKKFINQGLILNKSYKIYLYKKTLISFNLIKNKKKTQYIYINKKFIKKKNILNLSFFLKKNKKYKKYKIKKKKEFYTEIKIEKMSKSKLNIITPDNIIKKYGIDCFRLYIIFFGPFKKKKYWNLKKINGIKRFLNKIWLFFIYDIKNKKINKNKNVIDLFNKYLYLIKKNFKLYKLHKIISILMIIFNLFKKNNFNYIPIFNIYLKILFFFVPNIIQEIWEKLNNKENILLYKLKFNKIKKKYIKYIIMVNNKKKDIIYINKKKNNINNILEIIKNKKKIKLLKIKKYIFKKNKILNILF
ncbi:MAG: class I tRNA ligase family protein [Candidatus Shikimatogenerans bostrichidophilus]|nr:MAG: class I tRNA ligase family protein [Candidatus Shikimatogenerans bostrichidophilus]